MKSISDNWRLPASNVRGLHRLFLISSISTVDPLNGRATSKSLASNSKFIRRPRVEDDLDEIRVLAFCHALAEHPSLQPATVSQISVQ